MAVGQVTKIEFKKVFQKQFRKQKPNIQAAFLERLEIFKNNPLDPILSNHKLSGDWKGFRSINVTGDFRAIYKELSSNWVKFYAIGTHSQLYG